MSSENKKKVFTPANLISFVRVAVGFVFFYTLYHRITVIGTILLMTFVILDILDGYVARHFNCTSDLGIVLDHGTDKLFAIVTLLILFYHGIVPVYVFFAFIIRDIALALGWILVRVKKKRLLSSRFYGKISGGFYFLLLLVYLAGFEKLLYPVMFITLILYYISAIYYAKTALLSKVEAEYAEQK